MRGRSNTKTDEQRFLEKVKKTPTCWIWNASMAPNGYGSFWYQNKLMGAHKVAFLLYYGPIPVGLEVCHRCDNPPCVNPDHLFLGTKSQNMKDASQKGRLRTCKKTHCPKGHEYSVENTRRKGQRRICRACQITYNQSYWRNHRG